MDDKNGNPELDDGDNKSAESASARITEADRRRMRQAQKLRENLQRRKQQSRSRRAGLANDAEGLPAANSTQDDG